MKSTQEPCSIKKLKKTLNLKVHRTIKQPLCESFCHRFTNLKVSDWHVLKSGIWGLIIHAPTTAGLIKTIVNPSMYRDAESERYRERCLRSPYKYAIFPTVW